MNPLTPLESDPRLRQDPLAPPPGYFDGLSARVLTAVEAEAAPERVAARGGLRAFPFRVPAGYFEALPQRVMAHLPTSPSWRQGWQALLDSLLPSPALRLAPALATLAVLVAVGYWNYTRGPLPQAAPLSHEEFLAQVAEQFTSSADEALLIEALTENGSSQNLPALSVDPGEAERYLLESGADVIESL